MCIWKHFHMHRSCNFRVHRLHRLTSPLSYVHQLWPLHVELLPLSLQQQTSPLGGWVFPASHHTRSPHPGRKPWGNKFFLHTHSDKCAFTSQGWKINSYRIQEHSSQELYTKTKRSAHTVWGIYTQATQTSLYTHKHCGKKQGTHQLNGSCLTPYLSKSKQSRGIVGKCSVPLLFHLNFQKNIIPSHPPLFFFSSLSLSLHHSTDQYQKYNDDEQPASRRENRKTYFCLLSHADDIWWGCGPSPLFPSVSTHM